MKKLRSVLLLLLCGGLFITFACGSGSETSEEVSSGSSSTNKEKFSYTVENTYLGDYGIGYYIEGVVTNKTDKDYSYVHIEFICYDKDGNNIGTATDSANSILANQTWKYKAVFLGSDSESVDHCDYHETTSW